MGVLILIVAHHHVLCVQLVHILKWVHLFAQNAFKVLFLIEELHHAKNAILELIIHIQVLLLAIIAPQEHTQFPVQINVLYVQKENIL